MNEIVVSGIFQTEIALQKALALLHARGVSIHDISYVKSPRLPDQKNAPKHVKTFEIQTHRKTAEGVAGGFIIGGILGAAWFALSYSTTLIASGGEVLLSGRDAAAAIGFAPGALIGALMGYFAGRKVPRHDLVFSDQENSETPFLLGVAVDEAKAQPIDRLLREAGAVATTQLDKKFEKETGL